MTENSLALIEKASLMLAEANTIQQTKELKDLMLTVADWAKRRGMGEETINRAREYSLLAERKMGGFLKEKEPAYKPGPGRGKKGSPPGEPPLNIPTITDLGITKKESSEAQFLAELPDEEFEKIRTGGFSIPDIKREARQKEEKNKRDISIGSLDIRKGGFESVLSDVYDIDAIITDPPYPKEYLECFSRLSKFASEHLKENGWCVVYSGQYHLPEVIKRLSENLTYVWTFCLYHVGKKQLVNGVNIMCGWKPVLIFSRGRKKMRFSAYDVVVSEKMEKSNHEWQQSESGVAGLIEIFSEPGQLIVDPFSGSGTFVKKAYDMKRKAVGAEIE